MVRYYGVQIAPENLFTESNFVNVLKVVCNSMASLDTKIDLVDADFRELTIFHEIWTPGNISAHMVV